MRLRLRARRWLLPLVAISLAAPLTLADSTAIAAPGDIDDPGTDPYVPTDTPPDNPVILASGTNCGVDVAMVFDLSNSVDNTELGQLKAAGVSMVDALAGTDSRLSVYNFATFAPASTASANAPFDLTSVTNATAIKSKINGLTKPPSADGGTNWEQGLQQVILAAGRGSKPGVVIFFTDGDPTVNGIPGPSDDHGTSVDQADVNAAIVKANQVKALPARVVPVGIGDGSNGWQQRLAAISGNVLGQDYYLVSEFSQLTALVQSIAQGLCNATIKVTKMVSNRGVLSPAGNWAFAATDTPATKPPNGLTAADGTLPFTVSFNSNIEPARRVRLTETQQPGYVLQQQAGANASCLTAIGVSVPVQNEGALGFSVNVLPLQTINCTVINAAPTLTLVKNVTNDNGGTATPANFTLTATGPTTFSGAGGATSVVVPGQYILSESTVSGYSAGPWSCVGGTMTDATHVIVGDGQNVTCTVVNDDVPARLTLVKSVINDNGGTATPANFTLSAAGPTPLSGAGGVAQTNVLPGTYTLSETTRSDYVAGAWTCTGAAAVGNQVTIALGQTVSCSIVNNDLSATLRLVKNVTNNNGGTALPTNFTLSAAGPTPISGAGGVLGAVFPGTYTLSETTVPGYAAGAWSCVGATSSSGNQVTIALAQTVTCTIINDDIPATLALVKTVVNDNGGTATAANFTLSATGPTPLTGAGGVSATNVLPGTYTLGETTVAGYAAGAWTCGAATMPDATHVTVALGQTVSCSITNNDIAATLALVKNVTNNSGGSAVPTDFTLTATGPTPLSGAGGVAATNVLPGTYTLSESTVPGYVGGTWNCGAATKPDATHVTVALGQVVSCSITNDDVSATLALVKTVVNDNGGTATPANFTLSATGPTPLTGAGGVSATNVSPGTYALSETSLPGYAAGAWSCGAATMPDATHVTVPLGQAVSCSIVNNDIAATLALVKTVTNNSGGTATPTDFTLTAAGPTPLSGAGGVAATNVLPGTYTLSETSLPGYAAGPWNCGAATMPDATHVAVALGQTVSCSITNDDLSATLALVKTVVNDNGGTATPANFTLSATGPTPLSGAGGVSATNVLPGTYTLSETTVPGYAASAWSCGAATMPDATHVTIVLGQTVSCAITNNDIAATLALVKTVVNDNGGTATAANFTLTATGPTPLSGAGGVAATNVSPGTYALSETTLPGYAAGAWSCGAATMPDATHVTVALGQTVSCSITNNDIAATLALVKNVTNNSGGSAVPTDFTLTATGPTPISGAGGVAATNVLPGTYTLSESTVPGYVGGAWNCGAATMPTANQVTVALGQTVSCSITNDDLSATLALVKTVVNDNGGTATAADFTLSATGPTPVSGTGGVAATNVRPGTYTLSETTVPGYAAGAWSCGAATMPSANQVTIPLGQTVSCSIVNNDIAATLALVKTVTNDNGGTATAADFTLSAAGQTPLSGAGGVAATNVLPGDYALSETPLAGYAGGAWNCGAAPMPDATHVTVVLGQAVSCSIVNNDIAATLALVKTVTNNSGGTAVPADFTLSADGPTLLSGAGGVAATNVLPGDYTLSETPLAGYAAGAWNCGAATMPDATHVTVALGQTVSCSINNNDIAATLALVKTVVNDNGGTATAADFTLSADGATPLTGAGGVAATNVLPGDYTLSETALDGYAAGAWSCGAAPMSDATHVTVALGQAVSCSIVNNDIAATMALVKTVTNNSGGTAVPADFTLSADGPTPLSGAGGVAATNVLPGDYTLSETPLAGYSAGAWNCGAAPMPDATHVTVALGQAVSCTINNDDVSATLALVKTVVNDNGGTAVPTDFTLSAAGRTPLSGDGGVAATNVLPGDYTLSETPLAGYSAGAWNCGAAPMPDATHVTVALGQPVSCSITNNDIAATLALVKTVTNNNTGDVVPTDFTLSADGPTPLSGAGGVVASNVLPGTFTLSETTLPGYLAGVWDCGPATMPDATHVTVALAEIVSCSINNDDIGPTWTLSKDSDPADGATVAPGGTITYTLTAVNTGPVRTGPLTITDDLSAVSNNAVVSIPVGEPSVGTATIAADNLSLTWTIPSLAANTSATLHYTAVIDAAAVNVTITNSATGDGTPPPLTCPTGSVDCATDHHVGGADLSITKRHRVVGSVDNHNVTVGVGDSFLYDLVVANVGVGAASGIAVNDSIPGTLVVDPASFVLPPSWTVNFQPGPNGAGGVLAFSFPGPLAPSASATLTFKVTVQSLPQPDTTQPPSPIVNTATVTSQTPDDHPGNNSSTETTPIKALTISGSPACRNDAPWLDYSITAVGFTPQTVEIRWWSLAVWNNGAPIGSPSAVTPIPASPLTGSVLWPGTVLDAAGNPTDWPGWTLGADGIWVESTGALGDDLRPSAVIQVVSNPSVATAEVYPPSSPICDPNPSNSGSGALPDTGGNLPDTGGDVTTLLANAAAFLLIGLGLSATSRRARRRHHRLIACRS